MASRPKPWEAASGTSAAVASGQTPEISSATSINEPSVLSPEPSVPERPTSLSNGLSSSSPYSYDGYSSGMGSMYGSGMGMGSMYGGYGRGMGMGSMYGMGGMGYGGMGGMYGGMGGMYGGMGGMGGMYGANGQDGGFAESTQATFQLIESIIGAFGGFAQMLEATYMATYSSFFTMISVAEQFGNLKNTLGSFFGIFTLIKYFKKIMNKLTGGLINDKNLKIDANEFSKFESRKIKEETSKKVKKISLKPLFIFLAMVIGTPYLLKKLVLYLSKQRNIPINNQLVQGGPLPELDISKIQFGKALYNFIPENKQIELELKQGDLVAILSKQDPMGKESKWWRVRSRDGKTGYIPGNYIEIIERKEKTQESIQSA